MESPAMGNMVPVDRVEEMTYFSNPTPGVFEAPNNGQNYNSMMNYPEWGQMPFSEQPRRRSTRSKAHHNSKRHHHQPTWTAECAPAPASPQWQAQSPPTAPAAETSFSGYPQQEPQGPVAVNLQGLPYALCRQNFLEAMLDQAGLANEIMGCILGEDQDTGKAVIYLASYNAALKCVQHFGGRRWDNTGPPVTAQVAEGQQPAPANSPTAKAAGQRTRKSRGTKNVQEQMNVIPVQIPCAANPGSWMMPPPAIPFIAVPVYQKGSDISPERDEATGSNGNNSPKITWADLTDEGEKENDLSEGLEGSTSAGSTGRLSHEKGEPSFFFGCDVDTDDGF